MVINPELERVIRKIKRCLAIAESETANPNEAAMAMRQAKALMREYRVSAKMIEFSEIGVSESAHYRVKRRPNWDRALSKVVADTFNCQTLCRWKWHDIKMSKVEAAQFVGVSPSEHIALYAYETLLRKLTLERREYASKVRKGVFYSKYSPETSANHFALAWVAGVRNNLAKLIPTGESDEHSATGKDLMALDERDKALVLQYIDSLNMDKVSQRSVTLDPAAALMGYRAGEATEVNHALTNEGEDQQMLSSVLNQDKEASGLPI